MKRITFIISVWFCCLAIPLFTFAQGSTSNKGTEFWTVWQAHIDGNTSAMNLYITGDVATTGTAAAADGSFSLAFSVTPGQITTVSIPNSAYVGGEGSFNKGIHITSLKNIVVYSHIFHQARSGATLVLPVNVLGKDYYSINYTQATDAKDNQKFSVFCVIGTEDNTTVEITPTKATLNGKAANTSFTVALQKGQVYEVMATADLTGSHIRSISTASQPCKKVAVYSGSTWTTISCTSGANSGDNLYQQVYPTATWGKNFVTAPLANRNFDVYRIIYSDPTATVQLNGATIPASALTNNLYYQFSSQTANNITSNKPIQLVQYAVTQGSTINCTNNNEAVGDPEMIFLSPIEQGLDHVTLYSTNQQNITESYLNIIIPASAASSFTLDGVNKDSAFKAVANNPAYAYAQLSVSMPATHNISASQPFNAIAYGFGYVESYGYAAGTDLKNLNEFVELKDPQTGNVTTTGCAGVDYKVQLTIPYQTSSITWDFKDGKTPVTENSNLTATTTKNGTTLYTYEYSKKINFSVGGSYVVVATVLNPTADECGSNEDIELDYTISDPPAAKFSAPAADCPNNPITFTDQSDGKDIPVNKWAWDFGDAANATPANPNTSTAQNPTHIYIKAGTYTVSLTVNNQNGCSSSAQQSIVINATPTAIFKISTPDCETRAVTFNDASTANTGTIIRWDWDFGDGTTLSKTDNSAVTHAYASANSYNASLTVTASTGCSNAAIQAVNIHPLPQVQFDLPDACLLDKAQFKNNTSIADGSEANFTYLWNYGDANATAANPNTSAARDGAHNYTSYGIYTVTLTVTSKDGCVVTNSQQFTVNGAGPTADFSESPSNTYCSSDDVVFINKASVGFGQITQIQMFWDYGGNQSNYTVYTKSQIAAAGFTLRHNYGIFNVPGQTKTYQVRMVAFTGSALACSGQSSIHTITIKANPLVTLSTIGSICQEAAAVQITENKNGFSGTGTFSGTGISATGLFDPGKAGPGTFTITYSFNAANSCGYSSTQQVTVYPTPTANAGPSLNVLEGGRIRIAATASGDEPLTYKWTLTNGSPATGLDHDNVLQPIASPADNISYMLTVISAHGCSASSTVSINVLMAPVVPNTFTPNGDGVNDKWEIKYLDTYPDCTVQIYNRNGEQLYSSVGYPTPWDGNFKGAPLPVGVYYYVINPKSGRSLIAGSVTIIR